MTTRIFTITSIILLGGASVAFAYWPLPVRHKSQPDNDRSSIESLELSPVMIEGKKLFELPESMKHNQLSSELEERAMAYEPDVQLIGIAEDEQGLVAWLLLGNAPSTPVRAGEQVGPWSVSSIEPTSIELVSDQGTRVLRQFSD